MEILQTFFLDIVIIFPLFLGIFVGFFVHKWLRRKQVQNPPKKVTLDDLNKQFVAHEENCGRLSVKILSLEKEISNYQMKFKDMECNIKVLEAKISREITIPIPMQAPIEPRRRAPRQRLRQMIEEKTQ